MSAERVIDCVSRVSGFDRKEITTGMSLDDLRLDSMDRIELVMVLEDEFDADLDNMLQDVKTVGDVVDVVAKLAEGV